MQPQVQVKIGYL